MTFTPRDRARFYKRYIYGTASAADNAEFAKVVSEVNTFGNVHIVIVGRVRLTAPHTFTKAFTLSCEYDGIIEFDNGAYIQVGSTISAPSTAMSAVSNRFRNIITSPNLALAPGDIVAIKADNEVDGDYTPHIAGGTQHPMELHKIVASLGSNQYKMAEQNVDTFITNPVIRKITPLRNVTLDNVRYTYIGASAPTTNCWFFYGCEYLRIINPQGVFPVPGGWWFRYCYNTIIEHCYIEAKYDPMNAPPSATYGYNFIAGLVTNFQMDGGVIHMCRHGFTTTNENQTTSDVRWGTPLLVKIKGIDFYSTRGTSDSFACLDTHSEGYGIIFEDCNYKGHDGDTGTGVFVQNRARGTTVKNCTSKTDSTSTNDSVYHVNNLAPDLAVEHCSFEGGFYGVRQASGTDIVGHRMKISHTRFQRILGQAVRAESATDNIIDHNFMFDCGSNAFFTYKSPVVLLADDNPTITSNVIPKKSNDYAFRCDAAPGADFLCVGNVLPGYGGTIFDTGATPGASLNSSWGIAAKNFV